MATYQIMRGIIPVATIKPIGQQSKKIMGENITSMTFDLPIMMDFLIGDTIVIFGETYVINLLPDVKKISGVEYNYQIQFQGSNYELAKMAYLFYDSTNALTVSNFTLMGNADTFIDLLVANANRVQSGWSKGVVDDTPFENISFDNQQCLSVLGTLATQWSIEWWVEGKVIHMTKKGVVEPVTFKYGKGNGLYDITRQTQTDKNIVTRLYAYGSQKNLPATYRNSAPNLMLPSPTIYLEQNVSTYGIIEQTVTFDDIYPHRTGIITSLGADIFTFVDSAIDFDVNAQLLPGIPAKVVFETGLLAGYTFNIQSFNNGTKTFIINTNTDEKAFVVPNSTLKPAIGDQYVLVDLNMPSAYITVAESALLAKATAYLADYSNPVVVYSVDADPKVFKDNTIVITLGDYIHFTDTDFGLDADIRIVGFTRDLQIPSKYTIDLTEVINIQKIVRQAVDQENQAKTLVRVGKGVNQAYNNALQAKATAEGVKLITDFWGVTIDPAHGIIASGTLLVGSGSLNNAGVTGVIDAGAASIRFYAGAAYEDKNTAPFRVQDDGTVYMTQANVTGVINAISGAIGNFSLLDGTLAMNELHGAVYNQVLIGDNVLPATAPNLKATGVFRNLITNTALGTGVNYGIIIEVGNADTNIALDITGEIRMNGEAGKTFTQDIGGGFGMRFSNGIYIETVAL